MLGIRYHKGIALDMYVGLAHDFVCDEVIAFDQPSADLVWQNLVKGSQGHPVRHVGYVVHQDQLVGFLPWLGSVLERQQPLGLRRVSLILQDEKTYFQARSQLFDLFPEGV